MRKSKYTEEQIIGFLRQAEAGMPLVRKLAANVWEVSTNLPTRFARVLFTVKAHQLVLLHGFIKKNQATPTAELQVARKRIDF